MEDFSMEDDLKRFWEASLYAARRAAQLAEQSERNEDEVCNAFDAARDAYKRYATARKEKGK